MVDTTYHNHWSQSASFRYGESLFRYSEDEDLASSRQVFGSEFRVFKWNSVDFGKFQPRLRLLAVGAERGEVAL